MEKIISLKKIKNHPYLSATFQLCLLCFFFFGGLYLIDTQPDYAGGYTLTQFERTASYSDLPPSNAKNWEATTLPERLSESYVNANFSAEKKWTSLWYKKQFDAESISQYNLNNSPTWAFYIIKPFANVAIYLNGSLIGESGSMKPPLPSFRRDVMFSFPKTLLKPKGNILYYRVAVGSRTPWPNHLMIGPKLFFEKTYNNQILLKKTIPFIVLIMMAVLTIFMLLIFVLRPQEKVYGWYSLATFVWMIHHSMKLIDHIPVFNKTIWLSISYWTLGLFVAFGTHYIAHFSKLFLAKINRVIFWWSILGGVVLCAIAIIIPKHLEALGQYIWVPSILLIGAYAVTILILAYKRNPSTENKHLFLAITVLTIVGVRDYLYDFTNLVSGSTFYIQFAAAFVIIYWALILIRRFAVALDTAETLNLELETRVAEKSKELKSFYDSQAESNREKATLDERQRIMRDMHDGLGGQLVQLVALANKNPALKPVRNNLELLLTDLRLIIDSLTIEDGDISTVLGAFRYRTEPLLNKVGLKYQWKVENIPEIESIGPTAVLQILRILQESITNITKHANASEITLTATTETQANNKANLIIEITDNGKGMPIDQLGELDSSKYGHGLNNMKYRAMSIEAKFTIINSANGVTVRLTIPF